MQRRSTDLSSSNGQSNCSLSLPFSFMRMVVLLTIMAFIRLSVMVVYSEASVEAFTASTFQLMRPSSSSSSRRTGIKLDEARSSSALLGWTSSSASSSSASSSFSSFSSSSTASTTTTATISKGTRTVTATTTSALSMVAKKTESANAIVVPGVGEEGCLLPSPSGVNTMPEVQQAAIVFTIFIALGVGTALLDSALTTLTSQFGWFQSFRYSWPVTLGPVFALAGVTHFTVAKEYENIYPSRGAWGIWYLPGSRTFHVAWTGVAELIGGIGLLVGGVLDYVGSGASPTVTLLTDAGLTSDCALALFLLTWAVTPANIFMFTHGAKLPMDVEGDVPITFHVVRFFMQIVLLGLLWQLGSSSVETVFGY